MDVGLKERKINTFLDKVSELKELSGAQDTPAKLQVPLVLVLLH